MSKIGIMHPGEMGVSIAASAINNGHQVYWLSSGRSHATRLRAEQQNLIEVKHVTEFCQVCEMIFSVCPPSAAEEVARQVATAGFKGIYLDANAISPQRAMIISQLMKSNHVDFIDASIIGGPAWKPGETWLYLSGKNADVVADCFKTGPLETNIIGEDVGRASALKMCYAAYSKGTTALLISILATAESLGVRQDLYRQWDLDDPVFLKQVDRRAIRITAKAWRFEGEMEEIASTFEKVGLPDGFHKAAAEVYRRMADLKNSVPNTMEQILAAITKI